MNLFYVTAKVVEARLDDLPISASLSEKNGTFLWNEKQVDPREEISKRISELVSSCSTFKNIPCRLKVNHLNALWKVFSSSDWKRPVNSADVELFSRLKKTITEIHELCEKILPKQPKKEELQKKTSEENLGESLLRVFQQQTQHIEVLQQLAQPPKNELILQTAMQYPITFYWAIQVKEYGKKVDLLKLNIQTRLQLVLMQMSYDKMFMSALENSFQNHTKQVPDGKDVINLSFEFI